MTTKTKPVASSRITTDDWLAALHEVAPDENDPTVLTAKEIIAAHWGDMGMTAAKTRLKALIKRGRVEVVRKAIRDTAGRRQVVTGYRLKKS